MSKPITKFGIFFFLFGCIFISLGVSFSISTKSFIRDALTMNATLVRYEMIRSSNSTTIMYTPVFSYVINGETIETAASYSSSSRSYRTGDSVEVFVSKEDPYQMKENSFSALWLLPIIFSGLGSLFSLIGSGILVYVYRSSLKAKKLISSGVPTSAPIIGLVEDSSITINGIHPLKAVVECEDASGIMRRCHSDSSMDIGPHIVDKKVTVYFDRTDHTQYFVDLDTIEGYGKKVAA